MRQAYRVHTFDREALDLIDRANAVLDDNPGATFTIRQLYYQLLPEIPNSIASYRRVVRVMGEGRMAGLVDWDRIEDRLRVPSVPNYWTSIDELVDAAIRGFKLDRWRGQRHYVEVWIEKDALSGVAMDATHPLDVTLMVNRGYSSITAMRSAALRIREQTDNGKLATIGYLGDHDPSGEDMVRDVAERLERFGAEVEVVKLAILGSDIERYSLPPMPVKAKDSRASAFRHAHGDECVELDALHPSVLRGRIETFILDYLEQDIRAEVIKEEDAERVRISRRLRRKGKTR